MVPRTALIASAVAATTLWLAAAAVATGQTRSETRCEPAALPDEFSSYADYCSSFRERPERYFHEMFVNSAAPKKGTPFALRGCTYGCVVGDSFRADLAASPENGGSWSGKCFRDFNGMQLPSSVVNIVHSPDFQYEAEAFPGDLNFDKESWNRRIRSEEDGVWALEYENSEFEFDRDFTGYRDEMREVAPGVVLGKVFVKPFTEPYNPFPITLEVFHFMLFQVCDANGGFPRYSFDREMEKGN
ncbi:hypothetical protein BSKO_10701 [Bryopsis sp. KO-2023]|nr:hypothetical protein BSKO_10701 [Bryopsis sp. KO-2023]